LLAPLTPLALAQVAPPKPLLEYVLGKKNEVGAAEGRRRHYDSSAQRTQ
jgi:hypothetical protein